MLNKAIFNLAVQSSKMMFPDYTNPTNVTISSYNSYTVLEDCFASVMLKQTGSEIISSGFLVNNTQIFSANGFNNSDYFCMFFKKGDVIKNGRDQMTVYLRLFPLRS